MKKSTIVILIVSLCLLVSGVIICGGVLLLYDNFAFDFENNGNVSYAERTETLSEKFVNVDADSLSGGIELFPSSADECVIECSESDNVRFDIKVDGDTLMVKRIDTRKWYQFIRIGFSKEYIKIYLPQGEYKDIALKTSSGKIVVNDGLTCDNLTATSTSGSIRAYTLNAEDTIELYSTSGSVVADTITAKNLTTSSTSGKTTIGNLEISGALDANATSGNIEISQVNCNSVSVDNSSGSIVLSGVISESSFDVSNTSGKIELLGCDAQSLDIKNISGGVRGTLLSDKVFVASSTSGKVRVPDTTQGGVCKVRTTSGSIDIDIK